MTSAFETTCPRAPAAAAVVLPAERMVAPLPSLRSPHEKTPCEARLAGISNGTCAATRNAPRTQAAATRSFFTLCSLHNPRRVARGLFFGERHHGLERARDAAEAVADLQELVGERGKRLGTQGDVFDGRAGRRDGRGRDRRGFFF